MNQWWPTVDLGQFWIFPPRPLIDKSLAHCMPSSLPIYCSPQPHYLSSMAGQRATPRYFWYEKWWYNFTQLGHATRTLHGAGDAFKMPPRRPFSPIRPPTPPHVYNRTPKKEPSPPPPPNTLYSKYSYIANIHSIGNTLEERKYRNWQLWQLYSKCISLIFIYLFIY